MSSWIGKSKETHSLESCLTSSDIDQRHSISFVISDNDFYRLNQNTTTKNKKSTQAIDRQIEIEPDLIVAT